MRNGNNAARNLLDGGLWGRNFILMNIDRVGLEQKLVSSYFNQKTNGFMSTIYFVSLISKKRTSSANVGKSPTSD